VKIKNIGAVKQNIIREFNRVRKDPALLVQIGEATKNDIISHARAGRDAETGQHFPMQLSESWIKTRKYLSWYNSTSEYFYGTERRKSNLTFTGKFLESFKFKINQNDASVTVFTEGTHPGYQTRTGSTKPVDNNKLLGYLEGMGFVFMGVSDRLKSRINVLTKRFIRDLIKTGRL
jgi:hypothetical protein